MSLVSYKMYCCPCTACGNTTSKAFARKNNGLCKACVESNKAGAMSSFEGKPDISNHPLLCPTCMERLRTPYQKRNGYHCDHCTKETDPEGYRREVMGYNDY